MPATTRPIEALRQAFTQAGPDDIETLPPIHPGEVLREEFMTPLGLSAGMVAKAIDVPRSRIERIVKEEIGISTDTAVRLAPLFRVSPQFWTNLQTRFEIETLHRELGPELQRIRPVPQGLEAA